MSWQGILLASLLTICVFPKTSAGPASSLAMAIAARDAKIPRSIRAPFKNTEIMTARGFGKRSESVRLINYPSFGEFVDHPPPLEWAFEEGGGGGDDEAGRIFPINFIVNELLSNPAMLRQLIRRFVDVNNDGLVTHQELMMGAK